MVASPSYDIYHVTVLGSTAIIACTIVCIYHIKWAPFAYTLREVAPFAYALTKAAAGESLS